MSPEHMGMLLTAYFSVGSGVIAVGWHRLLEALYHRQREMFASMGYNPALATGVMLFAIVFILIPLWPVFAHGALFKKADND